MKEVIKFLPQILVKGPSFLFRTGRFCIVADRGMISEKTLKALEAPERNIPYTLGTWMRKVKDVKFEVLSRAGSYKKAYPEGKSSKDPSPLKVK